MDHAESGCALDRALVNGRRKDGDHCGVHANVTPVLDARRVTGYVSVRTVPSRDEVARAEALHATVRAEATSLCSCPPRGRSTAWGRPGGG